MTTNALHSTFETAGQLTVIGGFKHKGLRAFYEEDSTRGVNAEHTEKLRRILSLLDAADRIEDVDVSTMKLHSLKGDLKGFWAVTVRANWRVIFRFENGIAKDIDYLDYH